MNLTSSDAIRYFEAVRPLVEDIKDRELVVLPPFTTLWAARERLAGSRIAWGAQHVHPADRGPHTGDVSAEMLADLGCTYVEVGHAERRRDYGETDEYVAAQVSAIQKWGMTAIVCVGEPRPAPLAVARAVICEQLCSLSAADPARLVIAYEPVWAIGVGAAAASPAWISQVHLAIHAWFQQRLGSDTRARVIYGGSVDLASAATILAEPGVDGLFVGRNGLDPLQFARIAHAGLGTRQG